LLRLPLRNLCAAPVGALDPADAGGALDLLLRPGAVGDTRRILQIYGLSLATPTNRPIFGRKVN
jgi:hypothetical protein